MFRSPATMTAMDSAMSRSSGRPPARGISREKRGRRPTSNGVLRSTWRYRVNPYPRFRNSSFRPNQQFGPARVRMVQDQSGTKPLERFEIDVHLLRAEIDAGAGVERDAAIRDQTYQPERDVDVDQLARRWIVGERAERRERLT